MLENSTENFFVLPELFNHDDDDKAANVIYRTQCLAGNVPTLLTLGLQCLMLF